MPGPADTLPATRPDPVLDGDPTPPGFPPDLVDAPADADAFLLLRCALGIDPGHLRASLWREGSASAALDAVRRGDTGSANDREFLARAQPQAIRDRLRACAARFVVPGEDEYWPGFLRLPVPPPGVFLRGQPLRLGDVRVAVVGTRRPSAVGRDVAFELGSRLGAAGVVVVSGGALGIDAVAHRGALDAGGRSVAVLGCGIDGSYPRTNHALLVELTRHGTLVSEYAPRVVAEPHRFPPRNRLIAALSRAVVIVEGAERSGTRITAGHATDLGLELYAVPGSVASPLAYTPLQYIREGATMIRGADDLLADLKLEAGVASGSGPTGLPDDQQRVLDALLVPMLPDAVARSASIPITEAMGVLIELEMRGLVRGVGGRFERTFGRGRSVRPAAPG